MYHFNIKEQESGGYKFELDGIKIIAQQFTIEDGKHKFLNPSSAIAYFNIGNNVFGVSNNLLKIGTAEDLFDSISKQYAMLTPSVRRNGTTN